MSVSMSMSMSMSEVEIAIRGARVLDGTGNPWYRADIGIGGGRLVRIGAIDPADARRTIDADGLVVAPGFIDLHTHSDMPLLVDGDARSKVHQGVTLDVIGESNSVTPVCGPAAEEYTAEQRHRFGVEVDWTDLDGYFARLLRGGTSMNVASSVAPQQVRRAVLGFVDRPASADEIAAMVELVREAMQQGAVGLCSAWHGGGYEHFDELAAMAREAARYGGYYGSHIGNEGAELFTELDKALAIGRAADIPVHIYHLKARGRANWGKVVQVIERIEEARRQGLEVTANQYPYTAMQHPWHRLMPRWIQDAPRKEMLPRFRDPAFRARVRQDAEFQRNVLEHGDWPNIVMSQVVSPSLKPLEGKTVGQIAELQGAADPVELCFDLIAEEGAFPGGVYHTMSEDDVRQVMRVPWVSIGSDGSALSDQAPGYPHPRSFGTNVRVLGRYVREAGVLRLEDAIRKMTALPAQVLRLRDRGLLREGYWADVVVFDADRVADRATFDDPKQYAAGVEYVLVNGQLVIERAEHTGARPGQAIYGPGRGTSAAAAAPAFVHAAGRSGERTHAKGVGATVSGVCGACAWLGGVGQRRLAEVLTSRLEAPPMAMRTPPSPSSTPIALRANRSARPCTLPDGQTVFLRPVCPDDAAELLALFGRLSAESLHLRFFSWRQVELAQVQAMAGVDHLRSEAVVACLGPEPGAPIVGLASYDQTRAGAAEIAFVVEDGYQGRGLGRQLLDWIITAARARGFTRLHGETLTANGRMLRLVGASGYPCQLRHDLGSCEFSLAIGAPMGLPVAA